MNTEDVVKTGKVFLWSLGSSLFAGLLYALTVPEARDALATVLPWIVPLIPFINAVAFGATRYFRDNR